jgi:hypothetical protein
VRGDVKHASINAHCSWFDMVERNFAASWKTYWKVRYVLKIKKKNKTKQNKKVDIKGENNFIMIEDVMPRFVNAATGNMRDICDFITLNTVTTTYNKVIIT